MKVVVLLGGDSEEREVSLASGCQVARGLRTAGHDVVAFDTAAGRLSVEEEASILERGVGAEPPAEGRVDRLARGELAWLLEDSEIATADLFFPALHGGAGENGVIQTFLEAAELPYAGSGPLGCALSMDKDVSKRLIRDAGVPTPRWVTAPARGIDVERAVGLPVIVKPVSGGSSVHLSLVRDSVALEAAVIAAAQRSVPAICEEYIPGRELTVGVVGDEALPVGEIVPRHELFDYECKYQEGMAEEIFPAALPDQLAVEVKAMALAVHRVLRLRDFSRVDFMLDEGGRPWCLEANALPGLTSASLLPKAGIAGGYAFPELMDRIVRLASARLGG